MKREAVAGNGRPARRDEGPRYTVRLLPKQAQRLEKLTRLERRQVASELRKALDSALVALERRRNAN